MGAESSIEWTDATVNFWWGCTKVGPGCDHCYAEALDHRLGGSHWGVGAPRRKVKGAVALIHRLDNGYSDWAADAAVANGNARVFGLPAPLVPQRRRVFIQSMSDLFDLEVPLEWFAEAWGRIEVCKRLDIQAVTKRVSAVEKRLAAIGRTSWPRHVGLIITVVNQAEADRDLPRLRALKERFGIPWVGISYEPALGPLDLAPYLDFLDWVICGGESGPGARPMLPAWARVVRDQCAAAGVPFFFKQWGEWLAAEGDAADPATGIFFQDGDNFGCSDGHDIMLCHAEDHRGAPEKIWRNYWASGDGKLLKKAGKKAAGRLLDGVEHNGMPRAAS